jgi:hypothetical protein
MLGRQGRAALGVRVGSQRHLLPAGRAWSAHKPAAVERLAQNPVGMQGL